MARERHARLLAMISEVAPTQPLHDRLCLASADIVGVSSAALILMSPKETGALLVASIGQAAAVEDLQFTLGEGPCLLAFETGTPVTVPDLESHRSRWPMFVEEAIRLDVRAVFALPLQMGAIRLGVLYLCQREVGGLTKEQLADSLALADIATWLLLAKQVDAQPGELGPGLDLGWAHRAVVHQATGMVSAQLDVPLAEALSRLRSFAFSAERDIYDVARDVVGRHLRLER